MLSFVRSASVNNSFCTSRATSITQGNLLAYAFCKHCSSSFSTAAQPRNIHNIHYWMEHSSLAKWHCPKQAFKYAKSFSLMSSMNFNGEISNQLRIDLTIFLRLKQKCLCSNGKNVSQRRSRKHCNSAPLFENIVFSSFSWRKVRFWFIASHLTWSDNLQITRLPL